MEFVEPRSEQDCKYHEIYGELATAVEGKTNKTIRQFFKIDELTYLRKRINEIPKEFSDKEHGFKHNLSRLDSIIGYRVR